MRNARSLSVIILNHLFEIVREMSIEEEVEGVLSIVDLIL